MFGFLRRERADPLHVSMMGVRMGERVLQIGCDDITLLAGVAAKVGLSGTTVCIVSDEADAARAREAGTLAGALLELHSGSFAALPVDTDGFDVVIVDDTAGRFAAQPTDERLGAIREALRALRPGGRIAIVEGLTRGRFRGTIERPAGYRGDTLLADGGFHPVRLLAEGERYRFYEGLKGIRPT